ncbi:sensor histidine kinase [Streptococcus pneumoniae]|nr:sensor histidine kinase [Streptococcus pneumoniae]
MSHSFKKSLQKEILHRSSIAAFVALTRILRYSITDLEKETTICQDLKSISIFPQRN